MQAVTTALLVLGLTAAAIGPFTATAGQEGRARYITPDGAGTRDGSSWANAGILTQLPDFLARAGPGTSIYLRADQGPYSTAGPITLRNGGVAGRRVAVSGVDGAGKPMRAIFAGTRDSPYAPTGRPGSAVFRLTTGASHLHFRDLSFRNQGNGCFHLAADLRDVAIEDIDAVNVRRFVENYAAGRAESASIDGLTIRNVVVTGYSKGAIRLQYDTRNVTLEDIVGDSERQDGDNFAEGVALEGTVHDVVVRRVTMRNSHDTLHRYWNGDGFTTEKDTYGIRFEDTVASGNTDAGYDLKSSATVLVGTTAQDNKHNYKIWGRDVAITDCVGLDPHLRGGTGVQDQMEILSGADLAVTRCRFADNDAATVVFHVEAGAHLSVLDTNVSKHPDAKAALVAEGAFLSIK